MNILVTGGAGYIGSICVEQLIEAGHSVAVFDNLSEGHRKAVDPRAKLITGDLQQRCDIDDALEAVRPDAVMHFAANALVGESMQNPSKYFRNNVSGGLNLLDAMVAVGCGKFVSAQRVPRLARQTGCRSTRRSRSARSTRTASRS